MAEKMVALKVWMKAEKWVDQSVVLLVDHLAERMAVQLGQKKAVVTVVSTVVHLV